MKIFNYLIFPGICFSVFLGGLGWWLERKLTARFQYRVGPPWYQNFFDIAKLFLKETIIPQNASKTLFLLSPIICFSSALIFTLMITENYFLKHNFLGDVLVMLYFLIIPSLFIIIGGFSSSNPLAFAGSSREIKLMLAYEFIFIMSLIISIIKSGGNLLLAKIIENQIQNGSYLKTLSGTIGFILSIFYIQAKLGIVPFDIPEAEQEISAGPFIEYSGPLLGFYKLSKLLLYFSLPLFIISLFSPKNFLYKYLLFILIISVMKNINPRLRIKSALNFFWFLLFPLGILGLILALKGF
ncbi:MAG TPA: NADH-quinone oxidoreductase subunit H [Candidatus Omnitrophica bacterium]|nr:NADH-quinone oxidoreductase subunit H [Candidatus Omnitrophota bacterium]